MLSVIRKNQHSLTFFIVLLTIISFIWLYNRTNLSQVGVNDVATIYGRVVQQAQIEQEVRDYRLAVALGLTDFVRDMGGFAENEEAALSSFVFNCFILQHEAPLLNVVPTDEMIATEIQSLSLFQTQGAFDPVKYTTFMREQLGPRGFTERHLEEAVRDSLSLKGLRKVIVSPVAVSEAQVREAARIYQPITAQLLCFNREAYLKQSVVTPEEKKAFYEKNKNSFVSEEKRIVSYVVFALPSEQQKLEGKDRVHAMQSVSDAVLGFKQKSQDGQQVGKAFEKVAAENGLKVVTTESFNRKGEWLSSSQKQGASKKTNASTPLPPELIAASFKLAKAGAVSEVIQSGQSFYIISLVNVTPSQSLAFSEVDAMIETLLKEKKAAQQASETASKAYQTIQQAMAAGKKFAEAVVLTGQKPELITGVSPVGAATSKLSPSQKGCMAATLPLQEGELSELRHAPWGDFIVCLQQRAPLSPSDWETHHVAIEQEFLEQQRGLLFFEWLRKARADAKITMIDKRHRRSLFQTIFGK